MRELRVFCPICFFHSDSQLTAHRAEKTLTEHFMIAVMIPNSQRRTYFDVLAFIATANKSDLTSLALLHVDGRMQMQVELRSY